MEQRRRRRSVVRETEVRSSSNKSKNTKMKIDVKQLIFLVIAAIFTVMSIVFFANLVKFNMLPGLYITILGILLFGVTGFCVYLLVRRRKNIVFKLILSVVLVAVMGVYVFVMNYINATMSFMDTMTTEVEETEDYYVITLANGKYDSLEKLDGKNIHTFMAGEDFTDVKNGVLSKTEAYFKEDNSLQELAKTLLNGKIYAALVSNSQYNMLSDDNPEFKTKTRIIYTVTHKIKKIEENVGNEAKEQFTIKDGKFNIYVSGIDTAGKISNVARTDANIIVTVNTDTHKILLTSIPRDYYVTLHSKGQKDKLTHSGVYGIKETYTTVEDLLDIDINYYVRVNFTTLEKIVDALGGITVDSDYEFSSQGYYFKQGKNKLNGAKALAFSRERYSFSGGDRQRIKNQQAVIEGIMNKVLTSDTILNKYTTLLKSLSSSFQTNIKTEEINSIVKGQLNNLKGWTIESQSLDGKGANKTTYSYGSELLYVMIPNETSVSNAQIKINSVLAGK